jgi:hypothetical protein
MIIFIAYIDSFRQKGKYDSLKPENDDDQAVLDALELIQKRQWQEAMDAVSGLLKMDLSQKFKALAYNLHGTFAFLRGESTFKMSMFRSC